MVPLVGTQCVYRGQNSPVVGLGGLKRRDARL